MNIKNQFVASLVTPKAPDIERMDGLRVLQKDTRKATSKLRSLGVKRVLIVGAGEAARKLVQDIEAYSNDCYEIVGFIDDNRELARKHNVNLLGGFEDIHRVVKEHSIDEVVVVYYPNWLEQFARANAGDRNRVDIRLVPSLHETTVCRLSFEKIHDAPIVSYGVRSHGLLTLALKRLFDLVISTSMLLLLSPVALLVAIAIVATSPGSIFFKQERVGRNGKPFWILKFRSMVQDAEKKTGPTLASPSDPRITKIGAVLRKSRLDELPQLINVLKGEMSFVGPRPERPVFVEMHKKNIPAYADRHCIKPGITGLAQVQGHYLTDVHTKLRHDLLYANHMSLLLDLRIIWRTLRVVLFERNG